MLGHNDGKSAGQFIPHIANVNRETVAAVLTTANLMPLLKGVLQERKAQSNTELIMTKIERNFLVTVPFNLDTALSCVGLDKSTQPAVFWKYLCSEHFLESHPKKTSAIKHDGSWLSIPGIEISYILNVSEDITLLQKPKCRR